MTLLKSKRSVESCSVYNVRIKNLTTLLVCASFSFTCKTQRELFFPLEGGKIDEQAFVGENYDLRPGTIIYAKKGTAVRACESGVVTLIVRIGNVNMLVVDGKHNIAYGNLLKVNVSKGDTIERGSIIGKIPPIDHVGTAPFLEVIATRNGKRIVPERLW